MVALPCCLCSSWLNPEKKKIRGTDITDGQTVDFVRLTCRERVRDISQSCSVVSLIIQPTQRHKVKRKAWNTDNEVWEEVCFPPKGLCNRSTDTASIIDTHTDYEKLSFHKISTKERSSEEKQLVQFPLLFSIFFSASYSIVGQKPMMKYASYTSPSFFLLMKFLQLANSGANYAEEQTEWDACTLYIGWHIINWISGFWQNVGIIVTTPSAPLVSLWAFSPTDIWGFP